MSVVTATKSQSSIIFVWGGDTDRNRGGGLTPNASSWRRGYEVAKGVGCDFVYQNCYFLCILDVISYSSAAHIPDKKQCFALEILLLRACREQTTSKKD